MHCVPGQAAGLALIGWWTIDTERRELQSGVDEAGEGSTRHTGWLIAALGVFVLVCVAITFLAFQALTHDRHEPDATIPWGTMMSVTDSPPVPSQPPTSTLTDCQPDAHFLDDVTIPDGTVLGADTPFLKVWRVRNSGTCPWDETYQLRFVSGDPMGGALSASVPAAEPGEVAELSLSLSAPSQPGDYRGDWQLCASGTTCFGPHLFIDISVSNGTDPTPNTDPTPTSSSTQPAPSPESSPSLLPPNAGASEWLVSGSRAIGVREISWDTSLNGFELAKGEIYLSLYIVGLPIGTNSTIFSPLEIAVVDGDGEVHETLILERKDPPFALCTAAQGGACEGWWTTQVPDRNKTRRSLTLRWEPSLLLAPLETSIWQ